MRDVRPERSGWRDAKLSLRHRKWGWDCPAVDIDFLMCEYDNAIPVALVEYKHEQASPQDPKHASYRALALLATRAGIPFFGVRYADNFEWFLVVPLNDAAYKIVSSRLKLSEEQYVNFLYRLRGREREG